MRPRGQGVLALAVAAAVIAAAVALDRLGPRGAAAAGPARAPSGAWFCPHGGGDGWTASVYLANPGTTETTVRLTTLGRGAPGEPSTVTVPAGTEVREEVPAGDRASATFVEFFGGWVAAGWVVVAGGKDVGVGAEPCAPRASRLWYAADNTTQQGQEPYLVVMNPFGVTAVLDVALYTADRAPIRASQLTDISLRAHRSLSIRLSRYAANEEAVAAEVQVTSGRAAAASLGVTEGGGVRSELAWQGVAAQAFLPVAAGTGQSQLAILVPGDVPVTLEATLLSNQPAGPVQGLQGEAQDPAATRVYPVNTAFPSAVHLRAQDGGAIVAALRSIGVGGDGGATAGAISTASAWVVTPTAAGKDPIPGLVLVNPGDAPVVVTLHLLAPEGGAPAGDVSVTVPAGSALGAPEDLFASALFASVLVTSEGGGIVAMGVATSPGRKDTTSYALAMGQVVADSSGG